MGIQETGFDYVSGKYGMATGTLQANASSGLLTGLADVLQRSRPSST